MYREKWITWVKEYKSRLVEDWEGYEDTLENKKKIRL